MEGEGDGTVIDCCDESEEQRALGIAVSRVHLRARSLSSTCLVLVIKKWLRWRGLLTTPRRIGETWLQLFSEAMQNTEALAEDVLLGGNPRGCD